MFITIEGIDGSGKSTAVQVIAERLRTRFGVKAHITSELNHTFFGIEIKKLINKGVDPLTELMLISTARAHHLETVLRPQLNNENWVICDRYVNSTIAYQGHGRQLGTHKVLSSLMVLDELPVPDLTIFIHVSPAVAKLRLRSRGVAEPMDNQDPEFYRRAENGFADEIGLKLPESVVNLTNEDISREQFESAVAASLDFFLQSKNIQKAANDAQ